MGFHIFEFDTTAVNFGETLGDGETETRTAPPFREKSLPHP